MSISHGGDGRGVCIGDGGGEAVGDGTIEASIRKPTMRISVAHVITATSSGHDSMVGTVWSLRIMGEDGNADPVRGRGEEMGGGDARGRGFDLRDGAALSIIDLRDIRKKSIVFAFFFLRVLPFFCE